MEAEAMVEQLNRKLVGWAQYFCLGPVDKAYRAIHAHTTQRLRRWLGTKHKVRRAGFKRYPASYLHQTLGLVAPPRHISTLHHHPAATADPHGTASSLCCATLLAQKPRAASLAARSAAFRPPDDRHPPRPSSWLDVVSATPSPSFSPCSATPAPRRSASGRGQKCGLENGSNQVPRVRDVRSYTQRTAPRFRRQSPCGLFSASPPSPLVSGAPWWDTSGNLAQPVRIETT
ncbi:MAG: group II intron maturase-specific domain-containing protein [Gammaproteobacteria bacterium]